MRTQPGTPTSAGALEQLEQRVGPVIAQTVDSLQVAALLEVDGVTDDLARRQYGFDDVFALATELRRRLIPGPVVEAGDDPAAPGPVRLLSRLRRAAASQAVAFSTQRRSRVRVRDGHDLRLLSHGILYLLPAAVFPAVLSFMSRDTLVLGLAVGAGVAWVWAGGATWLAYQLAGAYQNEAAARVLRSSTLIGLPCAAAVGATVALVHGGGWTLVAVACGQMAYQMGATLLVYYRSEADLVVTMLPAVVGGVCYLLTPAEMPAALTVMFGALCICAVLTVALVKAGRHGGRVATASWRLLPGSTTQLCLIVAYTAVTAAYLLHAQSRFMLGSLEVSIGLLPLVAGMGVVELQAFRFRARSRAVMSSVRFPNEFASSVSWLLATDILLCLGAVAGLGAGLLLVLQASGLLTAAGFMMTAASTFLAGAYYLSFLLTGMAKLVPLCAATGLCLLAHVLVVTTLPIRTPVFDTAAFAATSLTLLVLFLIALLPSATLPRAHA